MVPPRAQKYSKMWWSTKNLTFTFALLMNATQCKNRGLVKSLETARILTCCLVNVCKWKAIHLENKWIKAHFKHETCYKLPCFGKVTFSFTTKLYEVNSIYLQGCLNTVINLTLVLIKKGHKREVKAKSKSSRSPAIITVIILIFTANFIVIFSWTFLSKGKGAWEVWSTNPPEDTTQRTATTPRTSRPTLFD